MKRSLISAALAVSTCAVQAQWSDFGNPTVIPGTNFLGSINNARLDVITYDIRRFTLLPDATYTITSFPNQVKDGALLLSSNVDNFYASGANGPFSRLHLHDGTTAVLQTAYRPWMDNGLTFTTNSDQMYIGHKVEPGFDQTAAVVQWSDNEFPSAGPDVLKFIFSAGFSGSISGPNSINGREIARMHPSGWVGLGDWQSAGVQPAERLDVLDGRVRIRQLPDDPEAEELTKFLVVDDVDPASPEYGVVKWRHLPVVPPPPGTCDWTLLGAPGSNSNIATAYNGNPGCPQGDRRVGIGTNAPQGKLSVESRAASQGGPGIGVDVKVLSATNAATGLRVNVQPESGTINAQTGITSMVAARCASPGRSPASIHR